MTVARAVKLLSKLDTMYMIVLEDTIEHFCVYSHHIDFSRAYFDIHGFSYFEGQITFYIRNLRALYNYERMSQMATMRTSGD